MSRKILTVGLNIYPYHDLGNKLKELRGSKNQKDFANELGVALQTYNRYEKGKRKIPDGLMRLARILKTQNNNEILSNLFNGDEKLFDFVPLAEAYLSAGGGAFVTSEIFKDIYAFRKDWLKRIATGKTNLILMRIIGDSMEPTIKDGDMVMIDRGRTRILSGMIYAIGVGDTINIKRIEALSAETIRIISDNKADYPPYEKPINQVRILGQVVWSARQYVREE